MQKKLDDDDDGGEVRALKRVREKGEWRMSFDCLKIWSLILCSRIKGRRVFFWLSAVYNYIKFISALDTNLYGNLFSKYSLSCLQSLFAHAFVKVERMWELLSVLWFENEMGSHFCIEWKWITVKYVMNINVVWNRDSLYA